MKQRLLFTLTLLLTMMGAKAQHWTFDENQYTGETYVYCDIRLGTPPPAVATAATYTNLTSDNADYYEVAAFIDDEVRAVATAEAIRDASGLPTSYYFRMRVKGTDADMGKSITFKIYNSSTYCEYDATLYESPLPVTYDGEVKDPGQPGNLRHLYLNELTSISLQSPITVNKGETIDMMDYLTVTPTGAALPNNLKWIDKKATDYVTMDGSMLTATAVTGSTAAATVTVQAGQMSATAQIIVVNPATALTIKDEYKTITVEKGDWQTLSEALDNAYTLTPADATDPVTWSVADNSIANYDYTTGQWTPLAAGTTTMTATIHNADGSPRLTATLTVNVIVPLEAINVSRTSFDCNVGDDLTAFLHSLVSLSPTDATDTGYWFQEADKLNLLTITPDDASTTQTVIASKAGTAQLRVRSMTNWSIDSEIITITIHNPAKEISFINETIHVTGFTGTAIDITRKVTDNIVFGPAGCDDVTLGRASYSVGNTNVVRVLGANNSVGYAITARAVGTSTVTVTFTWTDYLALYNNPESSAKGTHTVTGTFNVVVTAGLTSFAIALDREEMGKESTVTLTPSPADATFDPSLITYSYTLPPEVSNWQEADSQVTPDDLIVNSSGIATFSTTPPVPGTYMIEVYYDGNGMGSQEIQVGMPVSLQSGWQWITLTYGRLDASSMMKDLASDVIEVRSQYEEMFNDPNLGYFGPIASTGLYQDECYKIKMERASSVVLYDGDYKVDGFGQNLNDGWTWVANPYFFKRNLSHIIGTDGDRIVSKESGFAEYDGTSWVGTLTQLEPGQGYLYMHDGNSDTIGFPCEFDMPFGDDTTTGGSGAHAYRFESPWQYDASLFRDNMSIIAKAANADDMYIYNVGAFVGDECRGEGTLVEGKLFITVNGKVGETVSFRFYNATTGETFDAQETVTFRNAMGSLKAPVTLTKMGMVNAISDIITEGSTPQGEAYDVNGVRQQSLRHGINIIRQTNGQVKKVVVK